MAINEVRQVLMNGMGLTRESIREETHRIISVTAERFLGNLLDSGVLGDILVSAANKHLLKKDIWAKTIQQYVEDAAKAAAREWIKDNLQIKKAE